MSELAQFLVVLGVCFLFIVMVCVLDRGDPWIRALDEWEKKHGKPYDE